MEFTMGLSLLFPYHEDSFEEDIRRIALVTAGAPEIIENGVLSATAMTSRSERHGVATIPYQLVVQYDRGEISEEEYVTQILEGYEQL